MKNKKLFIGLILWITFILVFWIVKANFFLTEEEVRLQEIETALKTQDSLHAENDKLNITIEMAVKNIKELKRQLEDRQIEFNTSTSIRDSNSMQWQLMQDIIEHNRSRLWDLKWLKLDLNSGK